MYAKNAYQQPHGTTLPRIDVLLEIYDRLLDHLERARAVLSTVPDEARRLLTPCSAAVSGLATGLDLDVNISANFFRLYEYIIHCIAQASDSSLRDAQDILRTLRDGFQAVRPQALDLERAGHIPSIDQPRLQTTA